MKTTDFVSLTIGDFTTHGLTIEDACKKAICLQGLFADRISLSYGSFRFLITSEEKGKLVEDCLNKLHSLSSDIKTPNPKRRKTRRKLYDSDKKEIIDLHLSGVKNAEIAKRTGRTHSTIHDCIKAYKRSLVQTDPIAVEIDMLDLIEEKKSDTQSDTMSKKLWGAFLQ